MRWDALSGIAAAEAAQLRGSVPKDQRRGAAPVLSEFVSLCRALGFKAR